MAYIVMMKVDVLQVAVSASAIFGIGQIWINFNDKVFETIHRLAAAPFSWPKKKKDDSSSDSNDAEELNEYEINVDDDVDDDPSESG